MDNDIRRAFDNFLNNQADLEDAIMAATRASWAGGKYVVELLPDGSYSTLPLNDVGNKYVTPGIMLIIPPLTDDEYTQDALASDIIDPYFDNAIAELADFVVEDAD